MGQYLNFRPPVGYEGRPITYDQAIEEIRLQGGTRIVEGGHHQTVAEAEYVCVVDRLTRVSVEVLPTAEAAFAAQRVAQDVQLFRVATSWLLPTDPVVAP